MALRVLTICDKGRHGGGTRIQVDRAGEALKKAGLTVEHLRLGNPRDDDDGEIVSSTFWPHQGLLQRAAVLRKVAELRPDIIHLHGSGSSMSTIIFEALAKRWPLVVTLHDVGLFCMTGLRLFGGQFDKVCDRRAGPGCWSTNCWRLPGRFGPPVAAAQLIAKAVQRRTWLSAVRVVVPSKFVADLARQHGTAEEKLAVVPNICPPSQTPIISADARPHALFVGTLSRAKGADVALEALAHLPDREWSATFVGEGPDRSNLEARARELRLVNVDFAGWLQGDRLGMLREKSTVGIFPSRVMESFGLAGAECLASGRPVVGIARGGVSEWLLHGETGLAVSSPEPAFLSHGLAELLFDVDHARKLGEQGRRLVAQRFGPDTYAARMSSIYAEAAVSDRIAEGQCATGS